LTAGAGATRAGPRVEVRGIGKRYGGIQALDDVSFSIESASIHAIVGENGAGKSTLGKIIAGLITPTTGGLFVAGRQRQYRAPREALRDGIATVQQEITLVQMRTVIENVFLGVESSARGLTRKKRMYERFEQLSEDAGLDIPPDTRVESLSVAEQKKVEILKALARDAQLLILDEPTAALTSEEVDALLRIVKALNEQGKTIVYVSHFLQEVLRLADVVTVLRNGRFVVTVAANEATPQSLVTAMLGRPLSLAFPEKRFPAPDARTVCSVRNLSRRGAINNINLDVRAGEIVALAGLVGSGRTEVARAIFGADQRDDGVIEIDGRAVAASNPKTSVKAGIALLPENRKTQGLLMDLSVGTNVTLPHLTNVSNLGVIAGEQERQQIATLLRRLDVRPPDPQKSVRNLSGGNQQKALFAKWLFRQPRLLIADEPTAGVDVGAKRSVYDLIVALAADGLAVLLISSEIEEVLGLAHRVLVLRKGEIVSEFDGRTATQADVMRAAFAADPEAGAR
jgi:simple sugar transport system ATP-binding protein/ribose transport system ATP-binding protein